MGLPKVYICRRIPQEALEYIGRFCDYEVWDSDLPVGRNVLLEKVAQVEGLLTMLTDKVNSEVFDKGANLIIVANMAVGFDNIDIAEATKRKIIVTNTPGVLTNTTADLAFALLLATARRVCEAERFLRNDRWETWKPMELTGQDVYGRTLGIIGMGRIGFCMAKRARGFDMRVLYYDSDGEQDYASEVGAKLVPFEKLLRESDFISIHCPLNNETYHLISVEEFALMKPETVLINTARGPVVDEKALYNALKNGQIWGAGLDVYESEPIGSGHPLAELENVVLLPHIGSASIATRKKMAMLAAENLVSALTGQRPPTVVNTELLG